MLLNKMDNSLLKYSTGLRNVNNSSGAVLLTVVFVLIIIGLVGSAIYSLTFTSTYTQMNAQNATRAHYIADSGVRIVAAEYNQAADTNKNTTLESLHNETLTLPGNNGQIDLRIYPYWFYVNSTYTSGNNTIDLRVPGGFPVTDMQDPTSIASLPQNGRLKLQGKTQRAVFTNANRVGNVATFTLGSDKFPYDIQPDEEIFIVYHDNATTSQSINQEGDGLLLASTNQVAQFIPNEKGSFRVYNEDNDRMDYTYQTKVASGGVFQLNGVRSQDPSNPSLFPFTVDSNSEIYFGKNLAIVSNTAIGQGLFTGQKSVVTYSDVGLDGGFNIGRENISFEEDIEDFNYPGLPMNNPGGNDPIEVDETAKEINLGGGLTDGYGSVWYGGDSDTANCIDGKCNLGKGFRAYFEFISNMTDNSNDSRDHGDGFIFAMVSSVLNDKYDTGGPLGEYLGYAGPGLSGDGLRPPKIALELDTYPNLDAGSLCEAGNRVDDADATNYPFGANHIALDYWGAGTATDTPGSFNAIGGGASGGYMRIGSASPSNDDPEDWSSTQGTISFWFKRDTIFYSNGSSSGDRIWGQNGNMEMRFANNGLDLVLDWGANASLTASNHPFVTPGKWYFLAITWDETTSPNGILRMYWADEINPLQLFAENITWPNLVSSIGINENLFMNSSGGDGLKNFAVDGQGSDLRYYDIARDIIQIQGDYNLRLTGTEINLLAYFPLESDFANAAVSLPWGNSILTTGWSAAVPIDFDCSSDIITRDDNRHGAGGGNTQPMNSLNTDPGIGDDGYYQVAKGMSAYNWMEDGNCYGVRLELIRPQLPDGGVYKYQIKAWINSVDANCSGLSANYKDTRNTYTGTDPQIESTIDNGNPLELAESVHLDLKDILFGFTQATGGATQDITLKNLDMRFIYIYPVADLNNW